MQPLANLVPHAGSLPTCPHCGKQWQGESYWFPQELNVPPNAAALGLLVRANPARLARIVRARRAWPRVYYPKRQGPASP